MTNKKKSNTFVLIITPVLILIICICIIAAVSIKPYNKFSTYLDIAFMDTLKTKSNGGTVAGLHIKDTDIDVDYSASTSPEGEVIRPQFGEQFAVLRSDALSLSIPVYWGSSSELFEHGACQASDSAIVGTEGNAVISAHVNTFFSDLNKMKKGDIVTVNTQYGYFTYEVSEIIEFKKSDKKYVIPTKDTKLTLYTCKTDILGSSDIRTGVVCTLTDKQFYTE